jgi:thiaminase
VPVAALPSRMPRPWSAAVRHPFLSGVRNGSVPATAFDTWLAQDAHFVDEQAAARGLRSDAPRLPGTEAYRELLGRLDEAEPAVALTALWAVERAYFEAWTGGLPGAPGYGEFLAHWTTPEFAGYVAELERTAEALWAGGDPSAAVELLGDVLAAERAFWDMAFGNGTAGRV